MKKGYAASVNGDEAVSLPVGEPSDKPASPRFHSKLSYRQQFLAFLTLGLLNNLGYVLVQSSAKSLAESFDALHLLGLIQWGNVGMGVALKAVNAFFLLHYSYGRRITATALMFAIGFVGLALSVKVDFAVAVVAIVFIGSGSAFGESVILGYLKDFNPKLTGAWSSGTGFAGVVGTLLFLLMHSILKLSNLQVFLMTAPTVLIYFLVFLWVDRSGGTLPPPILSVTAITVSPTAAPSPPSSSFQQQHQGDVGRYSQPEDDSSDSPLLPDGSSSDSLMSYSGKSKSKKGAGAGQLAYTAAALEAEAAAVEEDLEGGLARTKKVFRHVISIATQLALVYFFEYVALVGFGSEANPNPAKGDWWAENAYEILNFCYQLGVLISRSSITVVQIKRIEIMTILQAANFFLWLYQAMTPFMPLWVQFIHMVFVGLLGGGMYVNCFYLLVKDKRIPLKDQELAINLTSIFINVGITLSAFFMLISSATFLKR